jgi:DNA (cytosine-5)-methyltransferase 1
MTLQLYPPRFAERSNMYELALCAGIGGLSLGLQRAGIRTACYVECDEYRIATLIARMRDGNLDNASIWDDVTTFDGKPWRGRIHLISAGFPCQPFSLAGKMRGTEDERYIWPDIFRIICEVRPPYILLENVPSLLMAKRGRGAPLSNILGDLATHGYDAEWYVLSAATFGAPHLRERIFLVAYTGHVRWTSFLLHDLPGSGCMYPLWETSKTMVLLPDRLQQLEEVLSEPSVFGDDDGTAHRVERLAAIGEAVVPQVAEYIGRCLIHAYAREE